MTILLKGYECTKILIANFLMGLKGVRMYRAEVALNREIAFPLFNTIKVWKRKHNMWNRFYRTRQGHYKRVRDPSKIPSVAILPTHGRTIVPPPFFFLFGIAKNLKFGKGFQEVSNTETTLWLVPQEVLASLPTILLIFSAISIVLTKHKKEASVTSSFR